MRNYCIFINSNYNLLIKTRVKNKRVNLGSIYFEKTYIITISKTNVKTTWLIKKKGTNCGINILI